MDDHAAFGTAARQGGGGATLAGLASPWAQLPGPGVPWWADEAPDRPDADAKYTTQELLTRNRRRMAIARHAHAHPGMSRGELAAALQIPLSTAFGLMREMLAQGWLREERTTRPGRRGRPLFLQADRFFLLGVHIDEGGVEVLAATPEGEAVALPGGEAAHAGAEAGVALAARLAVQAHAQLHTARRRALCIGVSAAGDAAAGASAMQLAAELAERLRGSTLQRVPVLAPLQALQHRAGAAPRERARAIAEGCRELLLAQPPGG